MQFQIQHAFRAMILFAFFSFVTKLHYKGELTKYINPKYEVLSQIAAGLFLFLFLVQLHRVWVKRHTHDEQCQHGCSHHHEHSGSFAKKAISYSILIFPLITGFFLPAKSLDASIAAKKGTMLSKLAQSKDQTGSESESKRAGEPAAEAELNSLLEEETNVDNQPALPNTNEMSEVEYEEKMKQLDHSTIINMKDSVFEPYYMGISMEPQKYAGRTVKLKGFVYKEEGFERNQLVISRFLITHCIADASIIGFLTEFDKAYTVNQDTWLEIEGTLQITKYNGSEIPVLKAFSWKELPEPEEPYVYPVITKME